MNTHDSPKRARGKKGPLRSKREGGKEPRSRSKGSFWMTTCLVILTMAWVGTSIIASQFLVGLLASLILEPGELARPVPMAIASTLSYLIAMALIIFVPPAIAKKWRAQHSKKNASNNHSIKTTTLKELGIRGLPTWTDIGLAPVGYIVYIILAAGLMALFNNFMWFDAEQTQNIGFSLYLSSTDRVIAFLTLVVVAPIAEEIIFRGWLYGKLRQRLSRELNEWWGMVIAIFLVSLLFGIVHMQWNVGVNVFALSIVLCALREITGTIYAGILLHMLKNGVAFYLLYMTGFN